MRKSFDDVSGRALWLLVALMSQLKLFAHRSHDGYAIGFTVSFIRIRVITYRRQGGATRYEQPDDSD